LRNPFTITLIGHSIGIITTAAAIKAMSMFHRRPMFITGEIGAGICLIIVGGLTTGGKREGNGRDSLFILRCDL
jgi:hypothetical protein